MANLVVVENFPEANIAERSKLSADAASGQAVITVENTNGLAANDYLLVGGLGSELGEIRQIQSISGLNVTLTANLAAAHKKNSNIYKIRGNQAKIYRAANVDGTPPANSAFSLLATINLEGDQLTTTYNDATGGSGFWYKYTFFNSTSSFESPIASAVAVRGGDYGHYCTVDDIRLEAGFGSNVYIPDQTLSDRRDDAESEVQGALSVAGYTLPLGEVPPLVRNITKMLAAGYLLLMDYGVGAEGSNKEGKAKLEVARALLKKIQDRELVLINANQNQAALAQKTIIDGWPDDTTALADENGGDVLFAISKKF